MKNASSLPRIVTMNRFLTQFRSWGVVFLLTKNSHSGVHLENRSETGRHDVLSRDSKLAQGRTRGAPACHPQHVGTAPVRSLVVAASHPFLARRPSIRSYLFHADSRHLSESVVRIRGCGRASAISCPYQYCPTSTAVVWMQPWKSGEEFETQRVESLTCWLASTPQR